MLVVLTNELLLSLGYLTIITILMVCLLPLVQMSYLRVQNILDTAFESNSFRYGQRDPQKTMLYLPSDFYSKYCIFTLESTLRVRYRAPSQGQKLKQYAARVEDKQ